MAAKVAHDASRFRSGCPIASTLDLVGDRWTLVILRDAVIVAGAVSYHLMIERVQASPLLISKLNTLMQLTLVFAVFRYGQYRSTDPKNAVPRAAADGVKGAIGLAVITLGYKYITH